MARGFLGRQHDDHSNQQLRLRGYLGGGMSDTSQAELRALERRTTKVEAAADMIPSLVAKQHVYSNMLQIHSGQLEAILGPKDSLLIQVGKMKGSIGLLDERLNRIDSGLADIKEDVSKLVESTELARANVAGQWQMRATLATAITAALSALAVAAMQYLAT